MSTIKYAAAVNLGNYESLRVEVEGEDVDTAKMALDQALASIQGDAGNPAVVDAIARYRKGVLGRSGLLSEERAPTRDSPPKKSEAEQGKAWFGKADPTAVARLEEPATTPTPAPGTLDQVSPLPERMPPLSKSEAGHLKSAEKIAADALGDLCKEPVKLSAPVQKQVESFGICDKCGEAVPKSQAKLSQLFMSKTLCKVCMEARS